MKILLLSAVRILARDHERLVPIFFASRVLDDFLGLLDSEGRQFLHQVVFFVVNLIEVLLTEGVLPDLGERIAACAFEALVYLFFKEKAALDLGDF